MFIFGPDAIQVKRLAVKNVIGKAFVQELDQIFRGTAAHEAGFHAIFFHHAAQVIDPGRVAGVEEGARSEIERALRPGGDNDLVGRAAHATSDADVGGDGLADWSCWSSSPCRRGALLGVSSSPTTTVSPETRSSGFTATTKRPASSVSTVRSVGPTLTSVFGSG